MIWYIGECVYICSVTIKTNTMENQIFLSELKALLKKHNASIEFTCSDCSDTHGLYNDQIQICINEKPILNTNSWSLTHFDIN